jgi:hypothetical protein
MNVDNATRSWGPKELVHCVSNSLRSVLAGVTKIGSMTKARVEISQSGLLLESFVTSIRSLRSGFGACLLDLRKLLKDWNLWPWDGKHNISAGSWILHLYPSSLPRNLSSGSKMLAGIWLAFLRRRTGSKRPWLLRARVSKVGLEESRSRHSRVEFLWLLLVGFRSSTYARSGIVFLRYTSLITASVATLVFASKSRRPKMLGIPMISPDIGSPGSPHQHK